VLDVPAGRAVLVTTIDATAATRPVTAALVLAIPVQADVDHNRSASEALATLIRSLVPRAPVWVEPLPMPPRPNAGRFFGGPAYAGLVHVGVPANDDRALRATLDRIDTALNQLPFEDLSSQATLVRVQRQFSSCSGLALDTARVRNAIRAIAAPLASPDADARLVPFASSMTGTSPDITPPACDGNAYAWPNVDTQPPTSASTTRPQQILVSQPIRFAMVGARSSRIVPTGDNGLALPAVRLAEPGPFLTVEGFSKRLFLATGRRYVYAGPFSSWVPAAMTAARLDVVRMRLRALVSATARSSRSWGRCRKRRGSKFAHVRRPLLSRLRERSQGGEPGGLNAVTTAPDGDACAGDSGLALAVADAAARAQRLADRLGATIDRRPVVVELASSSLPEHCDNPVSLLPIARTLAGSRPIAEPGPAYLSQARRPADLARIFGLAAGDYAAARVANPRIVAIDVRGPFVTAGGCPPLGDGIPADVIRTVPPLVVRLATSVRVSSGVGVP